MVARYLPLIIRIGTNTSKQRKIICYLRGSGGLEQLAFNVVAIESEVMPDGTRGRVRLKVLKNREWGELGICDVLMQGEDGRLHDSEDKPVEY